jgi:thioredoxin reductase (NADPH)
LGITCKKRFISIFFFLELFFKFKLPFVKFYSQGIQFIFQHIPKEFKKLDSGKILATWGDQSDEFDTVLLAVGRYPDVEGLNLKALGMEISPRTGKIIVKNEQTSIENLYALGDCIDGVPELTPSAIQAGRLLARRLYNGSQELMDYQNIATTGSSEKREDRKKEKE